MPFLFGKPFTQFTNLNILDELRIQGVLVDTDEIGFFLREVSDDTSQIRSDSYISGLGALDYQLLPATSGIKLTTIKCELGGGNITVIPDGTDTIEGVAASRIVTPGTSITIAPITGGWSES